MEPILELESNTKIMIRQVGGDYKLILISPSEDELDIDITNEEMYELHEFIAQVL